MCVVIDVIPHDLHTMRLYLSKIITDDSQRYFLNLYTLGDQYLRINRMYPGTVLKESGRLVEKFGFTDVTDL